MTMRLQKLKLEGDALCWVMDWLELINTHKAQVGQLGPQAKRGPLCQQFSLTIEVTKCCKHDLINMLAPPLNHSHHDSHDPQQEVVTVDSSRMWILRKYRQQLIKSTAWQPYKNEATTR
jgi:hypothetical protein